MFTKHSPNAFSRWFSLSLLMLALPFAAIAQPQPADDQDDEDESTASLNTVVVTGTHIEGLTEEQLPVTIMDDEAIERTGAINMQDILSYIPSISDFEFEDTNTATNGARGDVAGVNMRSLGSGNTLVLLNGRRMVVHPTFQAINNVPVQTYNVNSIPSSAISRIEVLRDGASPLYGADASAGVVNFVPYTGYDGLNISGRYGWSDDTNYDETEFTVAGGLEFNGGLTQLGLFGTFYDRSHVHQNELGEFFAELDRRGMEVIPEEWRNDSQWNNTSSLTPYARFRVGMLNEGGQFIGPTRHVDPVTGEIRNGGGSARYNFNETQFAVPSTERVNFMATFSHMMDNNLEFFADAFYYDASSNTQRAASPLDDSLAFLIVPPDAFYNPFPGEEVLLLGWRPVDLGPRIIDVDQDSWRLMGGLRGDWGGWNWESALVWSEAESTDTEGNRQAKSLFTEQVSLQTPDALNPFVGPGGNSQAALDAIRISATDVRSTELALWDLRFDRNDLWSMAGGDVGAAFGFEWRREEYFDDRDPRLDGSMPYTNGPQFDESDVVGVSATFDSGAERDTYSAYGELFLPFIGPDNAMPLAQALEAQLAARYESPDDFGSTVKPKVGLRWEPVSGLSFRGSYAEGFRAPNLPQMNQGTIIRRIDGIEDPLRADVTGRPIDTGATYRVTTRVANNDLDAEDTETTMIGLVFAPNGGALRGFSFIFDWWNIEQTDVVGILEPEDALDLDAVLRAQGSFNPDVIRAPLTVEDIAAFDAWNAANPDDQRTPVGVATNIINQYINLEPREVEGWDATIAYQTPLTSVGTFGFRVDATKITKFEQQGLATTDLLRRNGNPELRYTAGIDWAWNAWTAALLMRFVDDVYDTSLFDNKASGNSGTPDPVLDRIYWDTDEWRVYDLSAAYDFSGVADGWAGGLRLAGGIRNLTDEDAPITDESPGYFTSIHNVYGRVYWLRVGYQF